MGESSSPNVAPVTPISRPNGFASRSNRLTDSCPAAASLNTTKANRWTRFAALRNFWGSKLESGGGAPSGLPLFRYPARKYRYLPVSDPNPSWTHCAGLFRVHYESPDGARRTRLVSQRPAPAGAGLGSVLAEGLNLRDRHLPADSSLPRVAGLRLPEMACRRGCRGDSAGLMCETRAFPTGCPRERSPPPDSGLGAQTLGADTARAFTVAQACHTPADKCSRPGAMGAGTGL